MTLESFEVFIGPLIAIAATMVIGYFAYVSRTNSRLTALESKCTNYDAIIEEVQQQTRVLAKIQADNEVFWKVIEPHLANIIHSPIHVVRDALVELFVQGMLDNEGKKELEKHLRMALDDKDWNNNKRLAASLLLARLLTQVDERRSA